MKLHGFCFWPKKSSSDRRSWPQSGMLLVAVAWAGTAGGIAPRQQQAPLAPLDVVNAQIDQIEHRWLAAQNTGKVAALDRILAADFVRPAPAAGKFITKAELMAYLRSHPASLPGGIHSSFTELHVSVYGQVAIARGILARSDAQGHRLGKTLFTDVFVRRQGRWQAVSAQENQVGRASR